MERYNCLIVDDEPIAREILANYCSHDPRLQTVVTCGNTFEARNILAAESIQLLFLDIHMPVLNGIGFLKTVKDPPEVIFTTAYQEYAVQAFDLNACDYLVKPFPLERFLVAVDKAIDKLTQGAKTAPRTDPVLEGFFLKADGRIYPLVFNELLYAEAKGNYTKIVTTGKTITPLLALGSLEKMLPGNLFVRVHRAFLINTSKIDHIQGNRIFIGQAEITIGANYKEGLFRLLGF